MGKRPTYTDDFRAGAVALLEGQGWPENLGALERVARHVGVPANTLARWAKGQQNPPPSRLVDEKKLELSDSVRAEMDEILSAMGVVRGEASYRDLGVVFGILADKFLLLNGEPTENTQTTINFAREGVSTLPQHLAPGAASGGDGATPV